MSAYEIIAVVLSSVAIILSVPAVVLSVRQSIKMNFKIDFRPEYSSEILVSADNNNRYRATSNFVLTNKSDQQSTIRKITVCDKGKEEELIVVGANSASVFTNVPFNNNAIISRPFQFSISHLPPKYLTFLVYTNSKRFRFKIRYRLKQ